MRKNGRWKFSSFYGIGAAMGLSPREVGECSLWHFMAALDGYGRANGWKTGPGFEPMSDEKLRELGIDGFV